MSSTDSSLLPFSSHKINSVVCRGRENKLPLAMATRKYTGNRKDSHHWPKYQALVSCVILTTSEPRRGWKTFPFKSFLPHVMFVSLHNRDPFFLTNFAVASYCVSSPALNKSNWNATPFSNPTNVGLNFVCLNIDNNLRILCWDICQVTFIFEIEIKWNDVAFKQLLVVTCDNYGKIMLN